MCLEFVTVATVFLCQHYFFCHSTNIYLYGDFPKQCKNIRCTVTYRTSLQDRYFESIDNVEHIYSSVLTSDSVCCKFILAVVNVLLTDCLS